MFNKAQLSELMKKAQEMQKNMEESQKEIANLEVEGESGAGMVKVIMTGKHDLKKVIIDPSVMVKIIITGKHDLKEVTIDPSVTDDKEMLEDLIAAAVNDANRKVEKASSSKMDRLSAAIPGMPPGFKLPF